MNKRHHPRLKSHVEAILVTTNGAKHPCYIADFSQEGMRVFWPEGESVTLQIKDSAHVELIADNKLINIPIVCLYYDSTSAGFQLLEPSAALFLSFQSINSESRNKGSLSDEKRSHYKILFKQKVIESTPVIIEHWHREILTVLFAAASKAHNNEIQQTIFSAENKIKENQKRTEQLFLSLISEQLNRWLRGNPSFKAQEGKDKTDGIKNLSLIQQDEFEDWLITKVTTTHLQSKLSHSSFEIRQLLDIISEAKEEHRFNPIGPITITEAFSLAIKPLELENNNYRSAFQVFERVAAQQLEIIFEWLIKKIDIPASLRSLHKPIAARAPQGNTQHSEPSQIEPQVFPGGGEPFSPSPASNNTNTASDSATRDSLSLARSNSSAAVTSELQKTSSLNSFRENQIAAQQAFSKIQGLRALRNTAGQNSHSDTHEKSNTQLPQQVMAESAQVQSTLQQLWKNSKTGPGHVRQDLEQALASQEVALTEDNREAINTLEYVTKDLVENKHAPDFIKPLISELEQPLSMMMINDPSMIFNTQHPGRMALSSLSKLGLITTTGQDIVGEKLKTLMSEIDISANADDLVAQFKQLQMGVDALLHEAERRVKMNADRVAQAAAGEHRLEQAKKNISAFINKDTSGKTLPTVVMSWLEEGWKPLLTFTLLREGTDSKRFLGAIKLYRQVVALFNPKNSGRTELFVRFISLAKLMRRELDKLNGPLPKHTLWYDELTNAAEQHLKSGDIEKTVQVPTEPAEEVNEEKVITESKSARQALHLKVGDWLLLTEKDQNVSVVWIADDNSKFACVNHSGMKVIDFSLEALLTALDDGSVKRLYQQEGSAIDQSLDSLVKQIYNDLSDQANTDTLTQVSTRSHFMRHLKDEIGKLQEPDTFFSLCLLDIDQFKGINKEYGVEGGDECLKAVARHLLDVSGDKTRCARMGSHEFAIFLPGSDLKAAEKTATDIKNLLEDLEIHNSKSPFRIRLSIGVSELNKQITHEIGLLQAAESACLTAKEKGGSRVYRYIEDDASRLKRDDLLSWANKLNQALGTNQLELLYLPILSIQKTKKEKKQYEVIISINNEDGRQYPPLEYLQSTEHYSQMYLIDRWVLQELTQWMKSHKEEVNQIDSFMLKLSGYSMNDNFLLSFISEQVTEHGIPAHKLCFELNETSAIQNLEDATYFMHEMRNLGCQFILSDFGTGQSSFEYLKILPVDYVKIDQSFIAEIMTSPADHAMVKSIHEIANFMGKKTIAEKVHDDVTFDILQNIGIDLAMETKLEQAVPFDRLMGFSL
jgi:diguanylate cyclase (GGDEF)-like protein